MALETGGDAGHRSPGPTRPEKGFTGLAGERTGARKAIWTANLLGRRAEQKICLALHHRTLCEAGNAIAESSRPNIPSTTGSELDQDHLPVSNGFTA